MDEWADAKMKLNILSTRVDQIAKSLNGWHIENVVVLSPALTRCGSDSLAFLLFLRL